MRGLYRRTLPRLTTPLAATAVFLIAGGTGVAQGPDDSATPYRRDDYKHWIDADSDCQDTRQEVLVAESLSPVELDQSGCRVVSGRWFDPYTGLTVTNPSELDIDHFVPLAEAHRSGAFAWDAEARESFANTLNHDEGLIAVTAGANRSKGDRDPAKWLPPNEAYRCDYVRDWVVYKFIWDLSMDEAEEVAVRGVLHGCNSVAGGVAEPADRRSDSEWTPSAPTGRPETDFDRSAMGEEDPNCKDINSADAAALQAVSGIGPSRSRAIIEYRERAGPFADLDHVTRVSGIGPVTLQHIRQANFCVPRTTQRERPANTAVPSTGSDELEEKGVGSECIDINAASAAELQAVSGIGPAKARGILQHRDRFGPFRSLESVQDVSGIGPATLRNIHEAGFCVR